MPENQPQLIVLKDLESIARDFVCPRPFKFRLPDYPEKEFEIMIKPLTEALIAEARQFTQFSPPKIKVKKPKQGSEGEGVGAELEEVEEDNFLDPDFIKEVTEKSRTRRAFIFLHGLPDIKFAGADDLEKINKEIQDKFPEPYSAAIEGEILKRSTNELAIINLANFSASAGSAQS